MKALEESVEATFLITAEPKCHVSVNADGVYLHRNNTLLYGTWFEWSTVWNALAKEEDRITG